MTLNTLKENNFSSLLKKIVLDNNYDKPEEVFNKAERVLTFLKNSNNEADRLKYQELISKIQTDHNLKSFFDFFFKKKREERLKMFIMMQIQSKGKPIRKLKEEKKKDKAFPDEENEDGFDEDFEELQKKQKEAFLLYELDKHLGYAKHFIIKNDRNVTTKEEIVLANNLKEPIKISEEKKEINENLLKENLSSETNNEQQNNFSYQGNYGHIFNLLTNAYKDFILNKTMREQEAILGHYAQFNHRDFIAEDFEKSISYVNVRKNLGLSFEHIDIFNKNDKLDLKN